MTTETKFKETAETFNKNVSDGIKWMQDTNVKLAETQKEQLKIATNLFNSAFAKYSFSSNNSLNNSFDSSSKDIVEVYQKNMEATTNFLKTTLNPMIELATFPDKDFLSSEVGKQIDSFNKQINDLTLLSQTNFDTFQKQIDTTTKSFIPLLEKLGTELGVSAISSIETMQTIINSNRNFADSNIEARKDTLKKINDRIKTSIDENIKFWSDLMNSNAPSKAKTAETNIKTDLIKITSSSNGKKHTTESSAR